jgi:hypothetical protein
MTSNEYYPTGEENMSGWESFKPGKNEGAASNWMFEGEIDHILRMSDPDKKPRPELSPHEGCGGRVYESEGTIFCEKCGAVKNNDEEKKL